MSDSFDLGVLYTDYPGFVAATPLASLWSYGSSVRGCTSSDQPHHYWLHRSDPLLNTILPGTHVSIVLNLGDRWATGRSLPATSLVPPLSAFGPFTAPQVLRVGRHVRAIGAVFPAVLAQDVVGTPAPTLVNRIVALDNLWPRNDVDRLRDAVCERPLPHALAQLREAVLGRLALLARRWTLERSAERLLTARCGRMSIDDVATHYGISRQRFTRGFHEATGLSPKLFARIVRFQGLVHALLSNDVAVWASVASDTGFYDQAHMINEFRDFAGAPPTTFFKPHDPAIDPVHIRLRGRPSEWLRPHG
jgi:AraC-like DNA-binding protein